MRLDETVPGSGLGLAIVQELAGLYEGSLHLGAATGGGLRVELALPAVPDARVHHPPSLALRSSSKAGGLGRGSAWGLRAWRSPSGARRVMWFLASFPAQGPRAAFTKHPLGLSVSGGLRA